MERKYELNILAMGKGAREHILWDKLAKSDLVRKIYCIPGSAAIAKTPKCECVSLENSQIPRFVKEKMIRLAVFGPEASIFSGLPDDLRRLGVLVFAPGAKGVMLEKSKIYADQFKERYGIPHAEFFVADNMEEALAAIEKIGDNAVIKADGDCGGKGVTVCNTKEEAKQAAKEMLVDGKFGASGKRILVEKRLYGQELSVIAIVTGMDCVLLVSTQDHKPVKDGDEGPNTGGMGAYAPADKIASPAVMETIKRQIINPTLEGLKAEKIDYRGLLYWGIMVMPDGSVALLEFNIRGGDPETEVQLMLLDEDLAELLYFSASGKIPKKKLKWKKGFAVCVVAAAEGYPGKSVTGDVITGLESIVEDENHRVFHANTVFEDGVWKTAGGRVLVFAALAETLEKAIEEAYEMVGKVHFRGMHFRHDIGQKGL